jgi:hypothetical protein
VTFFDWLGRVVMLALAGMITLSIIGAIAAIPNGIVPQQFGIERQPLPVPEQRPDEQATPIPPDPYPGNSLETKAGGQAGGTVLAPVPPEPVDPARWLETISYALLALAGLAALGCLLLWRGVRQQRRIADGLEAISLAPPASFAPPS